MVFFFPSFFPSPPSLGSSRLPRDGFSEQEHYAHANTEMLLRRTTGRVMEMAN